MTSGEYAYALLRRLQRQFRCTNEGKRMYMYTFFFDIFTHPSVTLTEEAYNSFCYQMDTDVNYYAEQGLTSLKSIYQSAGFKDSFTLMQNSFATIGITVTYSDSELTFTLPDGTVKELKSSQGLEESYLCSRTGSEYDYSKKMLPYYDFNGQDLYDLFDLNPNKAGYGTYWEYDGEGELEINGEGSLVNSSLFDCLGIRTAIHTLILGAGVNRFRNLSLYFNPTSTNIELVFLHGSKDSVVFDTGFAGTAADDATVSYYYKIYTDNDKIKSLVFPANISATFHSLSEWNPE